MSEHFLKLVREELKSTSLVQVQLSKLTAILQLVRRSLMGISALDDLGKEVLRGLLRRSADDARFLAKVRLLKVLLQERVESSSVDVELAKATLALLSAEEHIFSPVVLRYGDKVAYKFTSNCTIGEKVYRRGEVALLSVKELVVASINECGEPLVDPFYKWYLKSPRPQ